MATIRNSGLKTVLRILGSGFLVAALAQLVFDVRHAPDADLSFTATSIDDLWTWAHPASRDFVHAISQQSLPALVWDAGVKTVLRMPVWFWLGVTGLALKLLGRRPTASLSTAARTNSALFVGFRWLGVGILAVAVVGVFGLSLDLSGKNGLATTTVGELWKGGHPSSLELIRTTVQEHAPRIWNPGLLTLLRIPAWLFVGLIGFGLYRRGARRYRTAIKVEPVAADQTLLPAPAKPAMPAASPHSELAAALASCRSAFLGIGLFSGMINVLMLTGAFFMLQIYDRVLPSSSVPTLVALVILAAGLFTALAILDLIRGRVLVRIGASLDEDLGARVYDTIVRLPLKAGSQGDGLQPLRDLDAIRAFLSGLGPTALFDLPWMPVYLAIIFAFHPVLGLTALVGAIILIVLTILTEILTRAPTAAATTFAQSRNGLAEAGRRNAEVLAAMGMSGRMGGRWREANQSYMASQRRVSDVAGGFGSVSKALRMMLQSAVLGVGAYFVINQEATAGIIIAGAILAGRALAPVDLAISNWRGFVAARQSWRRLNKLLELLPTHSTHLTLPVPSKSLSVEQASAVPPGEQKVVVQDASFTLEAGQGLGIIGPSASGKSSLVRMLVGVWSPARGTIRLDGAALDQWGPEALGRHIGYLPQDVELFAGTVAENIARFEPDAESEAIIAAARMAGVHELIVALPEGYDTEIGEHGTALSAGQRQRVALARALYGDPFLVVLDEPNSNLDSEGEAALTQAILGVRKRKGIVVIVAHRPTALAGVDLVLTMHQGKTVAFGPRDEVLAKVLRSVPSTPGPREVVKGRDEENR